MQVSQTKATTTVRQSFKEHIVFLAHTRFDISFLSFLVSLFVWCYLKNVCNKECMTRKGKYMKFEFEKGEFESCNFSNNQIKYVGVFLEH